MLKNSNIDYHDTFIMQLCNNFNCYKIKKHCCINVTNACIQYVLAREKICLIGNFFEDNFDPTFNDCCIRICS